MNKEQSTGRWTQLKGALKNQWRKFTDDDLPQIEGDYQKFEGTSPRIIEVLTKIGKAPRLEGSQRPTEKQVVNAMNCRGSFR